MTEEDLYWALARVLESFSIPGEFAEPLLDSLRGEGALENLIEEEDEC